jgi:hypothetical protein
LTVMVQVGAIVVVVANAYDSQLRSLRDMARDNDGKAVVVADFTMPPPPVELLTNSADVIVQGRVTRIEPRLNEDESIVFTHITLRSDVRFLKGDSVPNRPGFTPEFTFFYAGGTVRADGLEMTFNSNHAPDPPLQVGEEVLAFLVTSDEPRGLQVQFGAFGLLRVQGGKVASANKEFARYGNLSSTDVAELHRKVLSLAVAPKR